MGEQPACNTHHGDHAASDHAKGWRLTAAVVEAFEAIERGWTHSRTQRWLAHSLVATFLLSLGFIELARRGWLPEVLGFALPTSHFHALAAAFTLLLLFEVVELVLALPHSVADAAGKQFEILSLILLRQSFKELAGFREPLEWAEIQDQVLPVLSDAGGALIVFALLSVYARLQRHQRITRDAHEEHTFVATKMAVSLGLLGFFVFLLGWEVLSLAHRAEPVEVFDSFYTALILVDVLVVLVSLRYTNSYCVVFRYFGFAVATVLIRFSLAAPRFLDAALAVAAIAFAIALTAAYNASHGCETEPPLSAHLPVGPASPLRADSPTQPLEPEPPSPLAPSDPGA